MEATKQEFMAWTSNSPESCRTRVSLSELSAQSIPETPAFFLNSLLFCSTMVARGDTAAPYSPSSFVKGKKTVLMLLATHAEKNISQQVFLSIKQVFLLSPPHITLTATLANCLVHEFSSPLLRYTKKKIKIIKGPLPWLFFLKSTVHFGERGINWLSGTTSIQNSTFLLGDSHAQILQTNSIYSLRGSWKFLRVMNSQQNG